MNNEIIIKKFMPVSNAEAFLWFTDREKLVKWLCLDAIVEKATMGKYELFWNLEDRKVDSTLGCQLLSYDPPYQIATNWKVTTDFDSLIGDTTTRLVVSFFECSLGTYVTLVHTGWQSKEEWRGVRAWQEEAWQVALGRLEGCLNE